MGKKFFRRKNGRRLMTESYTQKPQLKEISRTTNGKTEKKKKQFTNIYILRRILSVKGG